MTQRGRDLIIGYHARVANHDYVATVDGAHSLISESVPGVRPCCAIFISGPRHTHINVSQEAARAIGARIVENGDGSRIVFHASYVDLPFAAGAQIVANAQQATFDTTLDGDNVFARIANILVVCNIAHADVVIHMGSQFFDDDVCEFVMAQLARCVDVADGQGDRAPTDGDHHHNDRTSSSSEESRAHSRRHYGRIFLETMSFDDRFSNPILMCDMFARHLKSHRDRIGLCVDTAHIWGAGADISTRSLCSEWFDSLDGRVPIAIHLNDSYNVLGSHRDKHACLGEGEIWSEGENEDEDQESSSAQEHDHVPTRDQYSDNREDGYVAILEWARENEAPVILERNGDVEEEVARDLARITSKLNFAK